jgi:two-component system response regulator FixJ
MMQANGSGKEARAMPDHEPGSISTPALVHLIDDDRAVRQGVSMLLRAAGFAVRDYPSATEFLERIGAPDAHARACALTDVRMPGIDGIELLQRLRARGIALPVVVMTAHGDVLMAVQAMKAGASDFIEKPFDDQVLLDAIGAALGAARPDASPQPDAFASAARRVARLTRREREVLDLLVAGRSNKMIAHDLSLSERTVEVHRSRMMERLGVRSLSEAVRLAVWAELAGRDSGRG